MNIEYRTRWQTEKPPFLNRLSTTLFALAMCGALGGCAIAQVQPWEKDILARKEMQLTPSPIGEYLEGKIYSSREASIGGKGVGGGGCGCN